MPTGEIQIRLLRCIDSCRPECCPFIFIGACNDGHPDKAGNMPQLLEKPSTLKGKVTQKPVQDDGIKIYAFSIDALCEDNARYWFHAMEKQLRSQFS